MKKELDRKKQKEALDFCEKLLKKVGITLNIDKVLSRSRTTETNLERALIVFILRAKGYSFAEIGSYMYRDHATALNLYNYRYRSKKEHIKYKEVVASVLIYLMEDAFVQIENERLNIKILKKLLIKSNRK